MTNSMQDLSLVNHLADKSDRYLFIFALVFGGACFLYAIRRLFLRVEEANSERITDFKELIAQRDKVIERNTESQNHLATVIEGLKTELTRAGHFDRHLQ